MKLKCLSMQDLEEVRRWRNEQLSILRTSFPLTHEMQKDFYKNTISNRNSNCRFWGITVDNTKYDERGLPVYPAIFDFIGMCGIENIQWENRLGEISLLLNPRCYKKEYMEKILSKLMHEAFNNLNLWNIYTEVYDCNPHKDFWRSQAEKYNASISILPNRKYYNGQYHDSIYINFNKGLSS